MMRGSPGLDALAKRGISVQDIPLFLVLGCENFQIPAKLYGSDRHVFGRTH